MGRRLARSRLQPVDVYRLVEIESDYVGTVSRWILFGQIMADVQDGDLTRQRAIPGTEMACQKTLFTEANADIRPGDGVFNLEGTDPEWTVKTVNRYSDHFVAVAEKGAKL